MQWTPLSPLEYFATLVQGESVPLLEAAASLAQVEQAQPDIQAVLTEMDRLQQRLKQRLPADAGALTRLRMLHHFFYDELGFSCNKNDYYAARNSYVHEVLRTRMGIPVSLAVLWLELALAIGLQAQGVSFPGHFLVKVRMPEGQVVIDPVSGQSLSPEALEARLEPLRDGFGVDAEEVPLALYLQAASARDILLRMLRNLKDIQRTQRHWAALVAVQDRLLVLQPEAWMEWRDRGLAHAELGAMPQAMSDLQVYLEHMPEAVDVPLLRSRLAQWRQAGM